MRVILNFDLLLDVLFGNGLRNLWRENGRVEERVNKRRLSKSRFACFC